MQIPLNRHSHIVLAHMNITQAHTANLQPIPRGVTFSKALSKLKAQSSNVSFHWNLAKETFELWAFSFETAFENVTPSGIGCNSEYHMQIPLNRHSHIVLAHMNITQAHTTDVRANTLCKAPSIDTHIPFSMCRPSMCGSWVSILGLCNMHISVNRYSHILKWTLTYRCWHAGHPRAGSAQGRHDVVQAANYRWHVAFTRKQKNHAFIQMCDVVQAANCSW